MSGINNDALTRLTAGPVCSPKVWCVHRTVQCFVLSDLAMVTSQSQSSAWRTRIRP